MSRWAPDNEDGLHSYIVRTSEWGGTRVHERVVYAESLKVAKSQYGWTRQLHTSVSVRRATPGDLSAMDPYRRSS